MTLISRGVLAAGGAVMAASMLWACGNSSPAAPTTATPATPAAPAAPAPVVTMAMLTAAPAAPANGGAVDYRTAPVTLVATAPAPPSGALIIDTFEYDDNAAFTSPTERPVSRQSGSTSAIINIVQSQIEKEVFWRVRASSGELRGDYSETFRFRVAPEPLRPPVLMEPASGTSLAPRPKLRLSKVMHAANDNGWSYDFEVATDAGFQTLAARGRVGENTTSVVNFTPDADLPPARYYWRARSLDPRGGASDFTAAWGFEVSEPFATAPVPLSPAPGVTIPQPAQFVVRNGPMFYSSTGTRYEVQVSSTASFATVAKTGTEWPDTSGTTTMHVSTELPGGQYYWRARSVTLKDQTRPEIASAWTDPRPVVLAGLVLGAPQVLSPADLATTALRPTLTVGNVARTGNASALMYRFEVSTDSQFAMAPAGVGTVREGAGSTSWTLPFDLPAGVRLWWRVQASDSATGTTSAFSPSARLAAVDSRTHLYALTLDIPAACGFINKAPVVFAQSEDVLSGTRFRLVSQDADKNTGDSLVLDVTRDAAGTVTGTITGSAPVQNKNYNVSSTQGSSVPAAISGRADGSGMSGTLSGKIFESAYPMPSATCTSPLITWSVTPRTQ